MEEMSYHFGRISSVSAMVPGQKRSMSGIKNSIMKKEVVKYYISYCVRNRSTNRRKILKCQKQLNLVIIVPALGSSKKLYFAGWIASKAKKATEDAVRY